MRNKSKLIALITVAALALTLIVAGLAGAHGRVEQAGLKFVFGGMAEPIITGERQWLELRVNDGATDEPVDGLAENLSLTISNGEWSRKLQLDPTRGKPGSYKAAIWFVSPGTYDVEVNGLNPSGEAFKLEYHTEVGDHRDLFFPAVSQ